MSPIRFFRRGGAVRPVRRSDVLTCPTGSEIVLFDPDSTTALGLNVSAAAIWTMCDGSRSTEEIVSDLADIVGLEPGRLRPEVQQVLDRMLELQILEVAKP